MKNLLRIVLLAACVPTAYSQSALYNLEGDSPKDEFGSSVSIAGDVNGDGYDDLIVGAIWDERSGVRVGSARVLSGVDGSVLYTFRGDSQSDKFGNSVSGAGDVNGDGFGDLLVGAPQEDKGGSSAGTARVYSGLDGKILYTFQGASADERMGSSVSSAGDVNGDGYCDLLVGSPGADNNGLVSGNAQVFSGLDGQILYTFPGDRKFDQFGFSVSDAGDVNGDGTVDFVVGAPNADPNGLFSGRARVFSGVDGSVLYTFDGQLQNDYFGWSVSGAGDVNLDGFDDVIIGAWFRNYARVFSGLDGRVLYTLHGGGSSDHFGSSVSDAGDVNGDGYPDLIVGAPGSNDNGLSSGRATVFSGLDGSVLYALSGNSKGAQFGHSVSGAGNVNGDVYPDLIVGANREGPNKTKVGSARVISGWNPIGTSYCGPAVPNSTGLSGAIHSLGTKTATTNELWVRAIKLPRNQLGYFLASETQGFVANPGGSQGNLCLAGPIARFAKKIQSSGSAGSFTIEVDLTNIPTSPPHTVLAGETWNFQAWFRDDDPGPTSNFTDAVSVLFQ